MVDEIQKIGRAIRIKPTPPIQNVFIPLGGGSGFKAQEITVFKTRYGHAESLGSLHNSFKYLISFHKIPIWLILDYLKCDLNQYQLYMNIDYWKSLSEEDATSTLKILKEKMYAMVAPDYINFSFSK